jgi:hypothetical protein
MPLSLKSHTGPELDSQALGEEVECKAPQKKTINLVQRAFVRFHVSSLPTRNPATDRFQRRVVIKPVACSHIRCAEVRNNVVIGDAIEVLVKRGRSALQGGGFVGW